MPHAGLMDERTLGDEAGPLQRARLHIRGGRRRLRQGKIAAGIVTLSDALDGALQWYIASPTRKAQLAIAPDDDLRKERSVFSVLRRSGIIGGDFDYDDFDRLVELALREEMRGFDYLPFLQRFEAVMTSLGVMPFDESNLPPEDPSTF